MKILNYALCALAGIFVFSSCTKADTEKGKNEKRSLTISIGNRTTKAVDEPVTGDVQSDYSSLYIYFTDGTHVVHSDVISDTTEIDDFKRNGKGYDNISSSITTVLVVANVKAGDDLPVSAGTSVTAIQSFAFDIASQQPDAIHTENTKAGGLQSTMIGESGLTATDIITPEGTTMMKAEITLAPIVARMEVSKELSPGEGIFSIQIDHVYLNNYYSDHSFAAGSLVDNGIDIAAYASNLQNDNYGEEVKAGTQVDAYHVFADGVNTAMPHIILEVSGFFKNAVNGQGEAFSQRYLTITKFSDATATGNIEKITANNIYKIDLSKLTVPSSVLDPTPEAGRISLDIAVEVAAWTVVNVTPEL